MPVKTVLNEVTTTKELITTRLDQVTTTFKTLITKTVIHYSDGTFLETSSKEGFAPESETTEITTDVTEKPESKKVSSDSTKKSPKKKKTTEAPEEFDNSNDSSVNVCSKGETPVIKDSGTLNIEEFMRKNPSKVTYGKPGKVPESLQPTTTKIGRCQTSY